MRKLLVVIVVLAVIVGALAVVDVLVKDSVQSAIAKRIESRSPGAHASVQITSFPFLGHLAASGEVPKLRASVTDLRDGDLLFNRIDLDLTDLRIDRHDLLHGKVEARSLRSGTVTADIAQSSIDTLTGLPLRIGRGTIGAEGVNVHVGAQVDGDHVEVAVAGLVHFTLTVKALDVLPCISAATLVPGSVELSCRFTNLPAVLQGASFSL